MSFKGFTHYWSTPMEAAEIISHCENCLIQNKSILGPFTATQIQAGALKGLLETEDYEAPFTVTFLFYYWDHC